MVECPLHGSEHEPWQCPEHTKHALQEDVMADVTKKSALDYAVETKKWRDYARGLEAQRDRLRKGMERVLLLTENHVQTRHWIVNEIEREVRAALQEEE